MKKFFKILIINFFFLLFFYNNIVLAETFLTKNSEIIDGKENRLEVVGLFNKPKGNGPFPAVIILQSCGGTKPHLFEWADKFNEWGYASFVVKSLEARNMNDCRPGTLIGKMTSNVASDAFGALEYLSKKPEVNPKKIAVIGFSLGAYAINEIIVNQTKPTGPIDFAGAISFYGRCRSVMYALERYPVIQFTASLDLNHHQSCADLNKIYAGSTFSKLLKNLQVVSYENAHHSFDDSTKYGQKDNNGNVMAYDRNAHLDSIEKVKIFLKKVMESQIN